MEIFYNNEKIKIEIIKKVKKTVSIKIKDEKNIILSVPKYYQTIHCEMVIEKNKKWILDKIISINKKQDIGFFENGTVYFLGKEYKIELEKIDEILQFKENKIIINEKLKNKIYETMINWYTNKAYEILLEKIKKYSEIMSLKPEKIRIKNLKSAWGICYSSNNITFNYKIIAAEDKIIDYLVVHELAHIKHHNHSREYWKFVENYIPECKELRKILKRDGNKYIAIDRRN